VRLEALFRRFLLPAARFRPFSGRLARSDFQAQEDEIANCVKIIIVSDGMKRTSKRKGGGRISDWFKRKRSQIRWPRKFEWMKSAKEKEYDHHIRFIEISEQARKRDDLLLKNLKPSDKVTVPELYRKQILSVKSVDPFNRTVTVVDSNGKDIVISNLNLAFMRQANAEQIRQYNLLQNLKASDRVRLLKDANVVYLVNHVDHDNNWVSVVDINGNDINIYPNAIEQTDAEYKRVKGGRRTKRNKMRF
jgi:hypothetical protein